MTPFVGVDPELVRMRGAYATAGLMKTVNVLPGFTVTPQVSIGAAGSYQSYGPDLNTSAHRSSRVAASDGPGRHEQDHCDGNLALNVVVAEVCWSAHARTWPTNGG